MWNELFEATGGHLHNLSEHRRTHPHGSCGWVKTP
jgi:hypothetical protein